MDAFRVVVYACERALEESNSQNLIRNGDPRRGPVATLGRREPNPPHATTPSTSSSSQKTSSYTTAALANPPDYHSTTDARSSMSKTIVGSSEASASSSKRMTTDTPTSLNPLTHSSAQRPSSPPSQNPRLYSNAPRNHTQPPVVRANDRTARGTHDPAVGRLHVPRGPAYGTIMPVNSELHRVSSSPPPPYEE
ncbi:hypothetical protein FRC03_003254 [Tulasnella sp. 419]|nr:hypothetical protein FRC03_003254 [Tulasnella sp. 419]